MSLGRPFSALFAVPAASKRLQGLPLPSRRRRTPAAHKLGPSRGLLITIFATKTRPMPSTWAPFHSRSFLCCSSSRLLVLSFSLPPSLCPNMPAPARPPCSSSSSSPLRRRQWTTTAAAAARARSLALWCCWDSSVWQHSLLLAAFESQYLSLLLVSGRNS